MSTTAGDLSELARKLKIHINGIYFKDSLPEKMKEGAYIINMDNHTGNGTHWLGLFKSGDNVIYFDSFGLAAPDDIEKWIKKNNINGYYVNTKQIQNIKEGYCGQYVILFLYYMTYKSPEDFYRLFI